MSDLSFILSMLYKINQEEKGKKVSEKELKAIQRLPAYSLLTFYDEEDR